MDDSTNGASHRHRVIVLPDISSQIHPDRASLNAVSDELEHLELAAHLRTACHHHRNRATSHHLLELLAPVGLHHPRTQLRSDAASQRKVASVSLFHLLAHCRHSHDGHPVPFALVYQLG